MGRVGAFSFNSEYERGIYVLLSFKSQFIVFVFERDTISRFKGLFLQQASYDKRF